MMKNEKFIINTPLGNLIVENAVDPDHPGVSIDLVKPWEGYQIPIALIEYCAPGDEADLDESKPHLITRVWSREDTEDYTDRIVHDLQDPESEKENV